jgi:hypothetical protein
MANRLLAGCDAPPVGKRWASNFVRRHKEFKMHFFRKYDYRRAKYEDPTVIRNWFRLVENTIAKYGIQLDEIYNFNEAGFLYGYDCQRNGHYRCRKAGKAKLSIS